MWDCWLGAAPGGRRQQERRHAWALLPLHELAQLVPVAGEGGGAAARSFLLPLTTDWSCDPDGGMAGPAAGATARGPALRVDLSYRAESCVMDAAATAATVAASAQHRKEQLRPLLPPPPGEVAPAARAAPAPSRLHAVGSTKACAPQCAGNSSSSTESEDENSLLCMNSESGLRHHTAARQRRQQPPNVVAPAPASVDSPTPPPEAGVEAVLSVEVVRACGLAAAVRAAAACFGSSSLVRAKASGPHAFARLVLFSSAGAGAQLGLLVPPLQTSFMPQCCTPAWHAQHAFRLRLTARVLEALAVQQMSVEVWHHCPRSEAVASALAAGHSSTAADCSPAAREVLLGAASCDLAAVLARPEGLRCWLPLEPAGGGGSAAGAVQVAVRLAEVAGALVEAPDEAENEIDEYGQASHHWSLLDACPEAAALLAPALRQSLVLPTADAHAAGFNGQQALLRLVVHEIALLPSSRGGDRGRPKAAKHFCTLLLSGGRDSVSITTASRTATAVGGGEPGEQEQWAVQLEHCTCFKVCCKSGLCCPDRIRTVGSTLSSHLRPHPHLQVTAGPALHSALRSRPLAVQVYKQQPAVAPPSRAAANAASYLGTAELDLWGLLLPPKGSAGSGARRVGGRHAVVDPCATVLAAATVALEVELLLEPTAVELGQARGRWELDGQEQEQEDTPGAAGGEAPAAPVSAPQQSVREQQVGGSTAATGASQAPALPGTLAWPAEVPLPQVQQASAEALPTPPAGCLLIQIDTALRVVLPAAMDASPQLRCWVQAVWGPDRQCQAHTPAVPVHSVEAGDMGGTAAWGSCLELPVPAADFAAALGRGDGGPALLLHLWASCSVADQGGRSPAPGVRPSSAAGLSDALIGCAAVDLASLARTGEVLGWWPVVDWQQQLRGQIKAAVRPNAVLSAKLHQQSDMQQAKTALSTGAISSTLDATPPSLASVPRGAAASEAQGYSRQEEAARLQELLAIKLQELETLSQQLGAAGVGGSLRVQQQQRQQASEAGSTVSMVSAAAAPPLPAPTAAATAAAVAALPQPQPEPEQQLNQQLEMDHAPSDDDEAASISSEAAAVVATAHATFGRLQSGQAAWSGSDSDDDAAAFLGVAFEGAVSPGFSDTEAEEHVEEHAQGPTETAVAASTTAAGTAVQRGSRCAVRQGMRRKDNWVGERQLMLMYTTPVHALWAARTGLRCCWAPTGRSWGARRSRPCWSGWRGSSTWPRATMARRRPSSLAMSSLLGLAPAALLGLQLRRSGSSSSSMRRGHQCASSTCCCPRACRHRCQWGRKYRGRTICRRWRWSPPAPLPCRCPSGGMRHRQCALLRHRCCPVRWLVQGQPI